MSNLDPQVPGQAAAPGPAGAADRPGGPGAAGLADVRPPAWRPALLARYERGLMSVQPPPPRAALALHTVGPVGADQQAVWPALLAWCTEGARTGAVAWPWRRPAIARPVALARLLGPPGAGAHHLAQALGEHLSRDAELAALTGVRARLALRLRVKLAELRWWRSAGDDVVWDAGWLRSAAQDPAVDPDGHPAGRLAVWSPRRPTLLLADEPSPAELVRWRAALQRLAGHTRQPVRLLLLAGRADDGAGGAASARPQAGSPAAAGLHLAPLD